MRRRRPTRLGLVAVALVTFAGCGATSAASGGGTAPNTAATYKITVAGDSISVGLGASIRGVEGDHAVVKVIGVEGTGLARPDTFDWPARLQQLAREFPPQVLVFSLSSNDAQDLLDVQGKVVARLSDTAAWDAEYERRLGASFDAFASTGTTVVWVGHVRTAQDRVGLVNRRVQKLAAATAASRPFVVVADLADLLGTGEQKADRCLIADGLHLTVACLDEAATKLLPTLAPR